VLLLDASHHKHRVIGRQTERDRNQERHARDLQRGRAGVVEQAVEQPRIALDRLGALASELSHSHPGAAASLREGTIARTVPDAVGRCSTSASPSGDSVPCKASSWGRVREVTRPLGPLTTTSRSPAMPSKRSSARSSASPVIDFTG